MQTNKELLTMISQSFHDGLDDIDKLLIQSHERAIALATLRVNSRAAMEAGAATIRRQEKVIAELGAVREDHIRAHRSAMAEATKMGWPTECPEDDGDMVGAPVARTAVDA